MHQRQRAWRVLRQAADRRTHGRVEGGILEQILRRDRRPYNIAMCDRRPVAELREQISTQQRAGRFLDHHAGVPAMRRMRRVDIAHTLATAEIDHLAVG
jgi:hypothetical protein